MVIAEYKTVQADNLADFDKQCNELSEQGFIANFAMSVVYVPSDKVAHDRRLRYIQQWVKFTNEKEESRKL